MPINICAILIVENFIELNYADYWLITKVVFNINIITTYKGLNDAYEGHSINT